MALITLNLFFFAFFKTFWNAVGSTRICRLPILIGKPLYWWMMHVLLGRRIRLLVGSLICSLPYPLGEHSQRVGQYGCGLSRDGLWRSSFFGIELELEK